MHCGRLQLQERGRGAKACRPAPGRPRRYCQKRLVNPDHDEDPRWTDVLERFHCNESSDIEFNNKQPQKDDDLFLSVQNLKFQGDEKQCKRPRTSFKYKRFTDRNMHRMFVKQQVEKSAEAEDEDRTSQLTTYSDDYTKYLSHEDRSRPSSGKSSIFLHGISSQFKENKAVQVDFSKTNDLRKNRKFNCQGDLKKIQKKIVNTVVRSNLSEGMEDDTKISYQKFGKRKSLTISRAQSPETLQVIRVDVVCNYSSSPAISDYEEEKSNVETLDKKTETINMKNSLFANKYLLTKTIKTLDENVSGGAKVTLLCKTFRLSDRPKLSGKKI